jgi:hypothetical protein
MAEHNPYYPGAGKKRGTRRDEFKGAATRSRVNPMKWDRSGAARGFPSAEAESNAMSQVFGYEGSPTGWDV